MKSGERTVLRESIESVELKGKKKVKVTCESISSGNEVYNIIYNNIYTLSGGGEWKFDNIGFNAKDFTIKLDSKESAEKLKNTLDAIMNGDSGMPGSYGKDVDPVSGEYLNNAATTGNGDSLNMMLVSAILIIVISIIILLWRKSR